MPKNGVRDEKKKNDKEAKKEKKSREEQRKKEKKSRAARVKTLKILKTELKESCNIILKRPWGEESEFECQFDRDIADLYACIEKVKDKLIKEKTNVQQQFDEEQRCCLPTGKQSKVVPNCVASDHPRQKQMKEAWSDLTDVKQAKEAYDNGHDDKKGGEAQSRALKNKDEQRETSEPIPDYPTDKTLPLEGADRHNKRQYEGPKEGASNEMLEKTKDTEKWTMHEYEKKINHLQQELEYFKKRNEVLIQENKSVQSAFEKNATLMQNYNNSEEKCKEMCRQLAQVRQAKEEEKHVVNKRLAALQSEIESLDGEVKRLTMEKNDALTRLSELAGRRLVENNPAIADLSTEIRPTKIGENFMQVYDNEWTDAFEELQKTGIDDDQCISILLSMTKENFDLTTTLAKKFRDQMFSGLSSFPEERKKVLMEQNNNPQVATKDEEQLINQLQRVSAARTVRSIQKYAKREREQTKYGKDCERFAAKCLEMCWYMAVQSPPLALVFDVKRLDPFNDKYFKKFVTTGDKFDFVVWPCILLHKNGPILAKGVAQAMRADSTKEIFSGQVVNKQRSLHTTANGSQNSPDKKEEEMNDRPKEMPQSRQGNQLPKAKSFHGVMKTDENPKNYVSKIPIQSTRI
uniref:Uncharacterized protein LOC111123295 n=1 Tax=Crassostrea virginica TaxID=6565 RepID=A0A8B8D171_CRAVI|nr:uncharacterized protein LOC111123295 [Crassostrea virginica]